jgi:hypothetical protein
MSMGDVIWDGVSIPRASRPVTRRTAPPFFSGGTTLLKDAVDSGFG